MKRSWVALVVIILGVTTLFPAPSWAKDTSSCPLTAGQVHRATGNNVPRVSAVIHGGCRYHIKGAGPLWELTLTLPERHRAMRQTLNRPGAQRLSHGVGPVAVLLDCDQVVLGRARQARVRWQKPDCSPGVVRRMRGLARVLRAVSN